MSRSNEHCIFEVLSALIAESHLSSWSLMCELRTTSYHVEHLTDYLLEKELITAQTGPNKFFKRRITTYYSITQKGRDALKIMKKINKVLPYAIFVYNNGKSK